MKKILTIVFIFLSLTITSYPQLEDRFEYLTRQDVEKYIQPFGTTLGMAFNSASYYSADIPDFFGFSISLRGMYFLIPDDDLTYMPSLPPGYESTEPTSTVYGGAGTAYYQSLNGYIAYPSGLNKKNFWFGYPQISASLLGTEVMLRYLPTIKLGNNDEEISMFGIGIKHSISRYIPFSPVDIAVQFLYNNLEITNALKLTTYAFNAHASRTFGLFTAYGGLQYESSSFDLDYTYTDPNNINPGLKGTAVKATVDGENNFRLTLGGALKLAVIVINADVGFGSQTVFTTGLTFEL